MLSGTGIHPFCSSVFSTEAKTVPFPFSYQPHRPQESVLFLQPEAYSAHPPGRPERALAFVSDTWGKPLAQVRGPWVDSLQFSQLSAAVLI